MGVFVLIVSRQDRTKFPSTGGIRHQNCPAMDGQASRHVTCVSYSRWASKNPRSEAKAVPGQFPSDENTEVALVEVAACVETPSNLSCKALTCSSNSEILSLCHFLAAGTQVILKRVQRSHVDGSLGEGSHLTLRAWQASQARDLFFMVAWL